MRNTKLTVVINTFRSEDKIYQCLNSIDSNYRVIIIENSNNFEFKKNIEKKYSNAQCYLTGENLGYAKGNNYGLSKVKSQFALILNPDTQLEKDTINNFFESSEKIKDFAIIGPAKQDEFSKKDLNENKDQIFEVNQLKGFAMFLNIKQFEEIGFFDKNFFIYLEEIDLCKRLKNRGKKIYLDKNIKIHHLGGKSHNKSIEFEMELSRNWHWMWSTFYFNKKHYGYFSSIFKVGGKFLTSILRYIFYTLTFNRQKKEIYYQRFSGLFNSMIGKSSWYRPKL